MWPLLSSANGFLYVPYKNDAPRTVGAHLPNLLCVGMEKSGTTFIHGAFDNSPLIRVPKKKELFFFNQNFDEGLSWYRSWWDWESKPGASYTFEATPSYFRAARTLDRIAETLERPKVVLLLRHPVYRAFSHYVHRLRHVSLKLGGYNSSFIDEFYAKNNRLLFPSYGECLEALLARFPAEDILVMTYEEDILRPELAASKLCDFLGLAELDLGDVQPDKFNQGSMPWFRAGGQSAEIPLDEGALALVHSKGVKVWKGVAPETIALNIDGEKRWSTRLDEAHIRQVFDEYYNGDLERLESAWPIDTGQWRATVEPVTYEAAPLDPENLRHQLSLVDTAN